MKRLTILTWHLPAACLMLLLTLADLQLLLAQPTNVSTASVRQPDQSLPLWPGLAPGETTREPGTALPTRPLDSPTITRIEKITQPTLDVFLAERSTGTAVLILPGGGFRYVVPDLEGSEAATWLNELGISAFVLRYRTVETGDQQWQRPLQDSQRAMRLLRARAEQWKIDPQKLGLLGFSAGGQVAAIHLTTSSPAYPQNDAVDAFSFRPDFSLLIYPWQIYDQTRQQLITPIELTAETPPAFVVHTHDDASSSLGAVFYYIGLKQLGVPAELHVYQTGGHGYGVRPRPNSMIGSWKDRASEWLRINQF